MGELKISVADFKAEVHSFHTRFIQAMGVRVESILHNNPFTEGIVDLDAIVVEYKERANSLDDAIHGIVRLQIGKMLLQSVRNCYQKIHKEKLYLKNYKLLKLPRSNAHIVRELVHH